MFSGLANGAYIVTPTNAGYTFTPASQNVTVNSVNVTGINFSAKAQNIYRRIDLECEHVDGIRL